MQACTNRFVLDFYNPSSILIKILPCLAAHTKSRQSITLPQVYAVTKDFKNDVYVKHVKKYEGVILKPFKINDMQYIL